MLKTILPISLSSSHIFHSPSLYCMCYHSYLSDAWYVLFYM